MGKDNILYFTLSIHICITNQQKVYLLWNYMYERYILHNIQYVGLLARSRSRSSYVLRWYCRL